MLFPRQKPYKMHKKKAPATKVLVRNPEKPKPKTTFINHYASTQQVKKTVKETSTEKPSSSDRDSKIHFKSPEPNSALLLARKIESVEQLKPAKVQSVASLAIDEKVTASFVVWGFCTDQGVFRLRGG